MVMAYLTHVAEEVREILASLGLRSLDEAIGRVDLLRRRQAGGRADLLDLSGLLEIMVGERTFAGHVPFQRQRSELGDLLYEEAWPALREGRQIQLEYPITTSDRTVGARLGGAVGHEFGEAPPPGSARVAFHGSAGLSFAAFLTAGVEFRLAGEANDYVGKGMGGGRVVITPPDGDAGDPWLVGNVVLYGATGGELFVAGRAGERFAVRNSGATAVVEGIGGHGCEYMTGGTVVVLGPVGQNLGAGMTGGEAYAYDPEAGLPARVNPELVEFARPDDAQAAALKELVVRHAALTGSAKARTLLANWPIARSRFWRVAPRADVAAISQKSEGTPSRTKAESREG
jgi:glutamate synthase (ferredoxin)